MQIVSLQFLLFIAFVSFIYFIIPRKIRHIWLLIASFGFYYLLSNKLLVLLLIVTILTYFAGRLVDPLEKSPLNKKALLIGTIVLFVGILGYYKYAGLMVDTVRELSAFLGVMDDLPPLQIVLPVGISFYLFQAIGYVIDCYRGTIESEKNYLYLALFISFFPQITAGPIERAKNMLPQYKSPQNFSYDNMRDGLLLMLWGYFQKIIIADRLAIVVNTVYDSIGTYKGTIVLIATICYAFEIYCDFAGYSNIAIGIAKIMGIKLMDNFKYPYLCSSVAQYWRNWHISLSSWFRDYLYIPLGGNRRGYIRKLINLMIVFAVSGLWHGASWTFAVWGLLHGLYQVLGIVLAPVRDKIITFFNVDRERFSHKLFKVVFTFILINIGWVFFRADSFAQAIIILKSMCQITPWVLFDGQLFTLGLMAPEVYVTIFSLMLLITVDICNMKGIILREKIVEQSLPFRWLIYLTAAIFVITCGVWGPGYDATSFIYSSF